MLLSLPPLCKVEYDFDLAVEFGCGLSDGVHYRIILYADHAI